MRSAVKWDFTIKINRLSPIDITYLEIKQKNGKKIFELIWFCYYSLWLQISKQCRNSVLYENKTNNAVIVLKRAALLNPIVGIFDELTGLYAVLKANI